MGERTVDDRVRRLTAEAVSFASRRDYGSEAEKVNRQILDLHGQDIPARNRLAQIFYARGERDDAIAMWQAVLDIDPGNPVAQRRLGELSSAPKSVRRTKLGRNSDPAVEVDLASEREAERIIRAIYSDDTELRLCLSAMVRAIRQVGHLTPDHGMISLLPRRVGLNVSKLAVVSFHPGTHKAAQYSSRLVLLAQTALVPIAVRDVAFAVSGEVYAPPRIASHLNWVDLPSSRLEELLPRCQAAHRAAVDEAADFGRSPFLKHHSPGVVKFINRILGERIAGP